MKRSVTGGEDWAAAHKGKALVLRWLAQDKGFIWKGGLGGIPLQYFSYFTITSEKLLRTSFMLFSSVDEI